MNKSQLVRKQIVDKTGRRQTKWVKVDDQNMHRTGIRISGPKHDKETRAKIIGKLKTAKYTSQIQPLLQAFGLAVIDTSGYGRFDMTLMDMMKNESLAVESDFFDKFVAKAVKYIEDNNIPMRPSDFDFDGDEALAAITKIDKDPNMTYTAKRQYIVDTLLVSQNPLKPEDFQFSQEPAGIEEYDEKTARRYKEDYTSAINSREIQRGTTLFSKYVNRDILKNNPMDVVVDFPQLKDVAQGKPPSKVRAYAQPGLGLIALDVHEEAGTVAHELGHVLDSRPDLKGKVYKYYHSRTKNEDAKWLGKPYSKNEITKKDEWMNAYTGKVYSDKATEVVSMWFTEVFRDPMIFAKLDPEHFKFGYNFLKGLI